MNPLQKKIKADAIKDAEKNWSDCNGKPLREQTHIDAYTAGAQSLVPLVEELVLALQELWEDADSIPSLDHNLNTEYPALIKSTKKADEALTNYRKFIGG